MHRAGGRTGRLAKHFADARQLIADPRHRRFELGGPGRWQRALDVDTHLPQRRGMDVGTGVGQLMSEAGHLTRIIPLLYLLHRLLRRTPHVGPQQRKTSSG